MFDSKKKLSSRNLLPSAFQISETFFCYIVGEKGASGVTVPNLGAVNVQ